MKTPKQRALGVLAMALLTHAALLAWVDVSNAPVSPEASHTAAGISIWHFGRFDLYPVNPPLVRVVAAAPVLCSRPETDWELYEKERSQAGSRPEWSVGIGFVRNNGDRARWLFALARWACIPFSLLGAYLCWRWAGELYGELAGTIALVLWCLSPNVIAWSATVLPDVAGAALGVAAGYCFWRWLKEPDWFNGLLAGITLGLAQLAKMTWIVLFALWPLVWLVWSGRGRRGPPGLPRRSQALQLAGLLLTGLFVLNLGYAFEGAFTRLGQFTFVSRTLAGADSIVDGGQGGNRFADTWLGRLPVPLPVNYVRGMDVQKVDFERGLPSYLLGRWRDRGWWYYYVVCAALKVPLGTWALGLLAVGLTLGRWRPAFTKKERDSRVDRAGAQQRRAEWADELVMLLPAVVLVVFVSSQTGFSRHFRYVLPAFPFLFVWISQVACAARRRPRTLGVLVAGALVWSATSSLWIYPHSMSYFNEIAGGPRGGADYLLDANLDWGQDVFYLRHWCRKHPEARPLHVLFRNSFSEDLLGIDNAGEPPPESPLAYREGLVDYAAPEALGPAPGWHAVSVHRIHDPADRYRYFLRFRPLRMAGYSIYIYHLTMDEANRVRRELGLPEWKDDEPEGSIRLPRDAS